MRLLSWMLALAVASAVSTRAKAQPEATGGESDDAAALGDPSGQPIDEEPIELEPIEAAPIEVEPTDAAQTDAAQTDAEPLGGEPLDASVSPIARVHERDVVSSSARTLLGAEGALWLELGITAGRPRDDEVALFAGEAGLRYRVAESIVADVSWGLSWAATSVRGEATVGGMPAPYEASHERLEPGNPTLGGAFVHRSEGSLVEVGLAIGIPTAGRSDPGADANGAAERESSALAQRSAMAMRGYRGAFRWAPERLSLAIPFRAVIPVGPAFFEIDGALALMLPVLGDRGVDADTLVDLGAGVGWNVAGPLAIGARVAGVGAPTGSASPPFTLSAEPWARLRFDPVQLSARGVLLLSGRDGLGRSRGPSFGVLLGAGVEL